MSPCACAASTSMRFEGRFTMGRVGDDFAEPPMVVTVPPFLIMKTEVTFGMYRACVQDGAHLVRAEEHVGVHLRTSQRHRPRRRPVPHELRHVGRRPGLRPLVR
ncbi:MAG: SUMF1/EgtB/PvdO family nonheme iron enzyme [bacterium]